MLLEGLVPRAHARLSEQDIRDAVQTVHAEDPCWFELTREDVTDVASSSIIFHEPGGSDEDTSDEDWDSPESRAIRQERRANDNPYIGDLYELLKGLQLCLRLPYPPFDLSAATKTDLQFVHSVCSQVPTVINRRWGPDAAEALADEADRAHSILTRVVYSKAGVPLHSASP
jgi:hypothetical protein